MAQVALKIETATAPATAFEIASVAFVATLATLETATASHDVSKAASKVTAEAIKLAERGSAWAAFDAALLAEVPADAAQAFAEAIALAKGVKPENFPVYRLRARDMVGEFVAVIAATDRAKANPLTLAKRLRDERNAAKDRVAAEAAHTSGAISDVADATGMGEGAVLSAIMGGDVTVKAAYDEALSLRMARAGVVAEAKRLRDVLATCDDATRDAVASVLFG